MSEVSQATAGKFPLGSRVRIELVRDGRTRYSPTVIRQAEDVFQLFREDAARWDREHFLALLLDGRHRVLGVHEVSVGTLTASLVHPRELFKAAFLANAGAVIVVHNHPSGDPTPSAEDLALTERLERAGELLGINVLDHVVVAADAFRSVIEHRR